MSCGELIPSAPLLNRINWRRDRDAGKCESALVVARTRHWTKIRESGLYRVLDRVQPLILKGYGDYRDSTHHLVDHEALTGSNQHGSCYFVQCKVDVGLKVNSTKQEILLSCL